MVDAEPFFLSCARMPHCATHDRPVTSGLRCTRIEPTLRLSGVCEGEFVGNVKEIKDRMQEAIDKGTTAVEKVHQDIMHKPIEVLELIAPNLPLTQTVAEVQTKIIGIVYDVIRGVNHAVLLPFRQRFSV